MDLNDRLGGLDDERRRPTTTLEGWRDFVDTDSPPELDLLPEHEWRALTGAEQERYDDARITYHSELMVVETSSVRAITRQGRLLTMVNRRELGARRGLIVSGPRTTGKSTALKQLGLAHELMVRARYPGTERIPVVYVTTPPKGSPRKLAAELARFVGLPPIKSRSNVADITDAVCQVLIDAHCDLVLIDEIHNLNNGTSAGEDMSDHIKYFTEHLPATFVYAGIDVEHCGLFTGVRGQQIKGRCVLLHTSSFPHNAEWKGLIATIEGALRLHGHKDGTLVGLSRYLHARTGGMIGSLSHLLRAAAIIAILEPREKQGEAIDRALLETVHIDYGADSRGEGAAGEEEAA
jgi:hypothetical protein